MDLHEAQICRKQFDLSHLAKSWVHIALIITRRVCEEEQIYDMISSSDYVFISTRQELN